MEKVFRFKDVPNRWALCFNSACERRETCMRFFAGRHVPEQMLTGNAVLPSAWQKGDCKAFCEMRTVRMARGFSHIFYNLLARHTALLREKVKDYLGGNGTYYRYLHGEKPLTPKQQEWIRQLFSRYGYADQVVFDAYETAYDFQG
ncbi:MAG: hypothetical protein IJM78_00785 [Prevotella sp.]|nr:hypothetical protein [Prevotella sp.]